MTVSIRKMIGGNQALIDGNWKEGPGKFGYGGDGETTKLEWGGDRNNKVTTYYFRHSFNIDESSKRPFVVADLIKDDGVVIYLNGNEVIRNNMPGGEIDFSSFSAKTAWEHNNNGPENNEVLHLLSRCFLLLHLLEPQFETAQNPPTPARLSQP